MATVNMTPARTDLIGVRAGDRNILTVRVFSAGTPVDLTGMDVTAQARLTPVDPTALDAVVSMLDAPNGLVQVAWPGEDVRTLLDGEVKWVGVWDMQVADGGLPPLTVTAGSFTAEMDVTR